MSLTDKDSSSSKRSEYHEANNVANQAIERMMAGSVEKESRRGKLTTVLVVMALGALVTWLSTKDFKAYPPEIAHSIDNLEKIIVKQDSLGHYFVKGTINQQSVTFIVDTGATTVAVPVSVAERLGLTPGEQGEAVTANGVSKTYATSIDSLQIGAVERTNVRATMVTGMQGEEILLGMSFLKNAKLEQVDGYLAISF